MRTGERLALASSWAHLNTRPAITVRSKPMQVNLHTCGWNAHWHYELPNARAVYGDHAKYRCPSGTLKRVQSPRPCRTLVLLSYTTTCCILSTSTSSGSRNVPFESCEEAHRTFSYFIEIMQHCKACYFYRLKNYIYILCINSQDFIKIYCLRTIRSTVWTDKREWRKCGYNNICTILAFIAVGMWLIL